MGMNARVMRRPKADFSAHIRPDPQEKSALHVIPSPVSEFECGFPLVERTSLRVTMAPRPVPAPLQFLGLITPLALHGQLKNKHMTSINTTGYQARDRVTPINH